MPPPLSPQRRGLPRARFLLTGAIAACALIGVGLFVTVRGGSPTATCDPDSSGWNGAGGGPRQLARASTSIHDPRQGWKPSWRYPVPGTAAADRVVAPPSVANGIVYTATQDGSLVAVDAPRGTKVWTSPPGPGEQGEVETPVALDGCGAVIATSFRGPSGEPQGALRAVDLRSHQRRWGLQAADEIFSAPEIVDGVAYAGLSFAASTGALDRDHVLDGYYVGDGSRGYRKRFSAAVLASPTSDHQHIWIGDLDQNVYALGPGGKQLWTYTTTGIVSLPAIDDGNTLIVASADHHVAALDPGNGHQRWNVQAAMAVLGSAVIAADNEGTVHALSIADGSEKWDRDLGAPVTRAVVAAGDRIFVIDDDGVLHVLDAANGKETVTWTAPAPPAGPPAIAAGHLYVTLQDGRLYALPL
jgi:outer membrane protein assembly factor BamB